MASMAKPREALSRGRIVQAALALVAREGLAELSTRKHGRERGCEAMSLYHFFPSKQHLLDALVEHAIESMAVPDPGLPALERVRRACDEYRAMAHRYPKLFPLVAVHRLNTPAGVRFIERILGMVRDATGDDETAARYFRAVGYYLIGAGLEETAGYAMGPSAAEPVSDEFIAKQCPLLVRSARYFQRPEWDRTFALGLDALFAAMAVKRTRSIFDAVEFLDQPDAERLLEVLGPRAR
jgi:AcrR family transcriptional regulator